MPEFNKDELQKLPPQERLAKIKELKENIQKQLEEDAKKLEEDSKQEIERQQKELELLLQLRLDAEKKEREQSHLEETVVKESKEIDKKDSGVKQFIDYNTKPTEQYVRNEERKTYTLTKELGPEKIGPKDIYEQ